MSHHTRSGLPGASACALQLERHPTGVDPAAMDDVVDQCQEPPSSGVNFLEVGAEVFAARLGGVLRSSSV